MSHFAPALTAISLLLVASAAVAQLTPAIKCEAGKDKIAAGYFSCHQKETAKALSKGAAPDYSNCSANFDKKWENAETIG